MRALTPEELAQWREAIDAEQSAQFALVSAQATRLRLQGQLQRACEAPDGSQPDSGDGGWYVVEGGQRRRCE